MNASRETPAPAALGAGGRAGLGRQFLRLLIEGALVVGPIGAIVLLVLGIVNRLEAAAHPLESRFVHPTLSAVLLVVLLCLLVGAVVQARPGRIVRRRMEDLLFERIPGYRLVRAFAAGEFPTGGERPPQPALASIEEGLCPALIMDRFADGRLLVFVPGSPAVMSGAIYIFTPDRVQAVDVPLMAFVRAVSSWGLGMRELIEAPRAVPAQGPMLS